MHVFEMVVLIVLIGGVVSLVSKYMDRKGGSDMLGLGDDGDPFGLGLGSSNSVSLERLEQLEERVAVLEKIVTDRNYDLKNEFDRL